MNKNQGATIGAILLAGLLLRPVGGNSPSSPVDSKAATVSPSTTEPKTSHIEGPWIASCKYWSPVRSDRATEEEAGKFHATLDVGKESADWQMRVEQDQDAEETTCVAGLETRWGLPEDSAKVHLKTMIAMVPDPVHSHASLNFDRTIDAIVEAAEDNGYTSSYYWLPWKSHVRGTSESASSSDKEPGHDSEREREPGLIIFKHVPGILEDNSPANTYYKVIYLFLVSETATTGVNGDQIKHALGYQEELALRFGDGQGSSDPSENCAEANHSLHGCVERRKGRKVSIIGPNYSGSAASLRAALDAHRFSGATLGSEFIEVDVAGTTSTLAAEKQLAELHPNSPVSIRYESFSDDAAYDHFELSRELIGAGYDIRRVFELVEDNTVGGQSSAQDKSVGFSVIRYPREISLLRNAQTAGDPNGGSGSSNIPSPYLQLSLKDTASEDSVPHFSREDTPLSQEAELMTIARTLNKSRAQFVLIIGSNILDELFLMQFLHRACPDVRLLFMVGDSLLEREVDNVPYIGSITVGAYPLIGTGQSQKQANNRAYPDSGSVAYYNAASYSFWDGQPKSHPPLTGYRNPLETPSPFAKPPLWETVIGSDGYYPLALLDECSSRSPYFQPVMGPNGKIGGWPCKLSGDSQMNNPKLAMYPSLLWNGLCVAITMLCGFHSLMMLVADYWSPFTRDLAIKDNVEPGRRSMYVAIGTAMLASMAFVVAIPLIPLREYLLQKSQVDYYCAAFVSLAGLAAVEFTILKIWNQLNWQKRVFGPERLKDSESRRKNNLCFSVGILALVALIGIPVTWACLCFRGQGLWFHDDRTYAGLLFAYRCIHPESGISPVVPILLLLFGWYLWAFCQTWRLRFSMESRPIMPRKLSSPTGFFVADEDLNQCRIEGADCGNPRNSCLYSNLTCILITRQIVRRFWRTPGNTPDGVLVCLYVGALLLLVLIPPMNSLESLVRLTHFPDVPRLYERLVVLLFFPLLFISLAGWLRMILIWGSLRRSVLENLEYYPIRFAFSQLRDTGWMTMVRQGGLQEWWRDMARSSESMRQMLNDAELESVIAKNGRARERALRAAGKYLKPGTDAGDELADELQPWKMMKKAQEGFAERALVLTVRATGDNNTTEPAGYVGRADHEIMHEIEEIFGKFAKGLLSGALVPYWINRVQRFVESEDVETLPIKAKRSEMHTEGPHRPLELHAGTDQSDPIYIRIAEEFLAIRYVSLIRSVLVNMRRLMSFVAASFVLAIIAWNSYPFEPRQFVDWIFTALLFILGLGIVWVLAQMYRDPILSRITDTRANELGFDFWARLVSLGAIPMLTWLAYTFPDVGSFLFKFFQPATSVMH